MMSVSMVKKDKFWDVVGTDMWQVNNLLDGEYEPRSADEVVKKARALVGARGAGSGVLRVLQHPPLLDNRRNYDSGRSFLFFSRIIILK